MGALTHAFFDKLQTRNWMVVTAESCTGGMIGARLTEPAGASQYFKAGFITYSNEAKIDILAVSPVLIEENGAVSAPVAEAMAEGALKASKADIAISVTGIAGPTGGTKLKPVGLVYIGIATWENIQVFEHKFTGTRSEIRQQSVEAAITHAIEAMG